MMNTYRRKGSYQLRGYDYSSEGAYFITVCTHKMQHFFGEVRDGGMKLSTIGNVIQEEWLKTPEIRQSIYLTLDAYCVMPNHFHALLVIGEPKLPHRSNRLPPTDATPTQFGGAHSQTIGAIMRGFKGSCTKKIRVEINPHFRWQPKFYDHIVRNYQAWETIRQYIVNNPQRWEQDRFYSSL